MKISKFFNSILAFLNNYIIGFGKEDNKEIRTFNALRLFFFLLIFLYHSSSYNKFKISAPALGVSGFIILSGFLNGYLYNDKYSKISIKEMFSFTLKRIKKFYPLHIIMLIVTISYSNIFNFTSFESVINWSKSLIKNILLIQSWWPYGYFSFNGVTWFLSSYLFLSLVTIPIMYLIRKMNKHGFIVIKSILYLILIFGCSCFYVNFILTNKMNTEYYLYIFPPARIFEYIIGILLGNLYKEKLSKLRINNWLSFILFTLLEIFTIYIMYIFITRNPYNSIFAKYIHWRINFWIIPTILCLIIFSYQKGLLSYIFKLSLFNELGKLTMYMFLIHQPIINLFGRKVNHLKLFNIWLFILTILFSIFYKKYSDNKKLVS